MTTYTATYSPDDNKLRLYASARLDAETFERVKGAGFRWAPKQGLFVAPMWTPAREDLLIELAGDIGDEDTSLVDRAAARAERFEDYSEKRAQDSERAHAAVQEICDSIPLGQPILVGHHSERHARRDQQRIENGMRKAVKMWETAQYWEARAAGCLHHAKYKELPAVRARRIKGIESDKRKAEKVTKNSELFLKLWTNWEIVKRTDGETTDIDRAIYIAEREVYTSACFPVAKFPRLPRPDGKPDYNYEGQISYADALREYIITPEWCRAARIETHKRKIAHYARWIAHYNNRLLYERAMLAEQGATSLLDKKPKSAKAQTPLLNYRAPSGSITTHNPWQRGQMITYPQVEMTKAEYAKINGDYKGTRWSADKSHRFRTAMLPGSNLACVFLTDLKSVPAPVEASTQQAAE